MTRFVCQVVAAGTYILTYIQTYCILYFMFLLPSLQLGLSYDDQYMFSVGEDGSLFVFKVTDKDGRGLKRDREVVYSEEILITKSDLEEKVCAYLCTRIGIRGYRFCC